MILVSKNQLKVAISPSISGDWGDFMTEEFNPFRDKRPTYKIIKERNKQQIARTENVLKHARTVVNNIRRRHEEQRQFESALASVELELGPLNKEQMDLVCRKSTGQISHEDFLEKAKILARRDAE